MGGFQGEVGTRPLERPEAAFSDEVAAALEDLDFAVGALDRDVDGAVGGGREVEFEGVLAVALDFDVQG